MAAQSPYAESVDLSYAVALNRRIKAGRDKGRPFSTERYQRWLISKAHEEARDVLLVCLCEIEKILGRRGAEWTPTDKALAEKWVQKLLLSTLVDESRSRGRPKKARGGPIHQALSIPPTPTSPRSRGRKPTIPVDTARWWCRLVFMIKLGELARRKGYKDPYSIKKQLHTTIIPSKVDAWISTKWALEALEGDAKFVTEKTGVPIDPSTLAYIKRNYSRLRGRQPL